MIITQMDRLFVSKMLSLKEFGYYSLAYTAGIAISLLQTSLNNAALPALAEAGSHGRAELAARYDKVSELTSFAVALPCALLVFFGFDILKAWVGEDAARHASEPLSLLAVGFFLNAAVSSAYLSAIAKRRADIPAAVNAASLVVYAPLLYWLILKWGPSGAAAGWAFFNASYIITFVPPVHGKVLHERLARWLWHALSAPILAAAIAVGAMKLAADAVGNPLFTWVALLLTVPIFALAAYFMISGSLRDAIRRTNLLGIVNPQRRAPSGQE
jgi:O-antigen/teichoic acid export membrane protein